MSGRELTVTTPSDREIVLTRAFNAPAGLVFDALTRPELLRRWFGAQGWQLVECETDLRVGGAWRFVSQGPGGAEQAHGGTYQVIQPPRQLVYTERYDDQSYPGDTLISHRLVEHAGVTTLTSTIRYATPEGRDRVLRYPMRRGVTQGYRRLDELLVELADAR
ncbi:SRPBCC family protein [Plantactinospora endophytica]|uniref:ATPase n=1 Tax=Plantactinospora endophytica TaxID=673535 RepID=A0ABQ4E209_9ACTN|nr:SRPBCC family protein [Plantactinospora endophytica]GIG88706.1 ATPase [Plantactinospora endophytica]